MVTNGLSILGWVSLTVFHFVFFHIQEWIIINVTVEVDTGLNTPNSQKQQEQKISTWVLQKKKNQWYKRNDRYIPVIIIFKHQRVSEEKATFKSEECWVITGSTAVIFFKIIHTCTYVDTTNCHHKWHPLCPSAPEEQWLYPHQSIQGSSSGHEEWYLGQSKDRVTISYDSPWYTKQ